MFLPYVAVSGIVSCSADRSGASGEKVSDEAVDDGESRGVCSDDSMSDIFQDFFADPSSNYQE